MEETCRLEISGLSRGDFLDLKRRMPGGAIEELKRERGGEELGVLDPITATVVVTLGLAAIKVLAAWILKNRSGGTFEGDIANGVRMHFSINLSSETSESDVVKAFMKYMPKGSIFRPPGQS